MGAAFEPGSAAGEAEMRKRQKYERLGDTYIFEPVAIETTAGCLRAFHHRHP